MIYFLSSEGAPTDSKANAESNVSNGIHPSIDCAAISISYDFEKKDLVMEGKTKLFQKYFLTFIIFCFFLPVANVDKVA